MGSPLGLASDWSAFRHDWRLGLVACGTAHSQKGIMIGMVVSPHSMPCPGQRGDGGFMNAKRIILAHVLSVYFGSGALLASVGLIENGLVGLVERLLNWLGGFLIFVLLAILTIPVGLILRLCAGFLPLPARVAAPAFRVLASLSLVPLLHPHLVLSVTWQDHVIALLFAHGLAGALGGWIWLVVERPTVKDIIT